jgi:hypothetical protein
MVRLTYRLVKEFDAEAVCIISNKTLTDKVVYGMVSRGIPAFGEMPAASIFARIVSDDIQVRSGTHERRCA